MENKITMLQAFNNLSAVIDEMRMLPKECRRLEQAMLIMGQAMQKESPDPEGQGQKIKEN